MDKLYRCYTISVKEETNVLKETKVENPVNNLILLAKYYFYYKMNWTTF